METPVVRKNAHLSKKKKKKKQNGTEVTAQMLRLSLHEVDSGFNL